MTTVEAPPTITFFVPGIPIPKGRMKAVQNKTTGFPVVTDQNAKGLRFWEQAIWNIAHDRFTANSDKPWKCSLEFVMPRPVAMPKKHRRPWHTKQPDLDKLVRGILDGLTKAGAWKSDSQVVLLRATKVVAAEGERTGVKVTLQEQGLEALE